MKNPADPLDQLIGRNTASIGSGEGYRKPRSAIASVSAFSKCKNMRRQPTAFLQAAWSHIARVLGRPIAFFAHEAEAIGSDGDPEARRLMRAVSKITDARLLRLAVRLIEEMAQ